MLSPLVQYLKIEINYELYHNRSMWPDRPLYWVSAFYETELMIHWVSNVDLDWAEFKGIVIYYFSKNLRYFSLITGRISCYSSFCMQPHPMALFKFNFYIDKSEGSWLQLNICFWLGLLREVDVVHCSNIGIPL